MAGSSDRKINYSLRPSKSIERKMIIDVLKEVCTPAESKNYRYIGFGASFFEDFKLIHKALDISDMISIESKKSNIIRCEFNKPYGCITVESGLSYEVLPKIDMTKKKTITWLDYEGELELYMFDDIETCCLSFLPYSFLIISLRREFAIKIDEFQKKFTREIFGEFKNEDFEPLNHGKTISKMFNNKINDILSDRSALLEENEKIIFKQLFNFNYSDDAKMYTFGGLFLKQSELKILKDFKFSSLNFISKDEIPFDISLPIITNREYHILNSLLPSTKEDFINSPSISFIPKNHRENYYNFYKYFPGYIEATGF